MKSILLSFVLFVFCNFLYASFAPVGAVWYYSEGYFYSGDVGYLKIESVKDTSIQGKTCSVLAKEHELFCSSRPDVEYVYEEDSTIYFWNAVSEKFDILYNFNAKKGDSWKVTSLSIYDNDTILIEVDSIDYEWYVGNRVKVLYTSHYYLENGIPNLFRSKVKYVYTLGDFEYLFNIEPRSYYACDGNYSKGLRCYSDPEFGYYSTGIADYCEYTQKWNYDTATVNLSNSYQGFYSNRTSFYKNENNLVKSVRFDSIDINVDTVMYSFPTLCRLDSTRGNLVNMGLLHYSTDLSSWMGLKFIVKPNGDNLFLNRHNDTIRIKSKAIVGESWLMWNHETYSIYAKVVNDKNMNIFGEMEKVKIISLKTVNALGFASDSLNHSSEIWLSEKYGLIQFPDFYYFPYQCEDSYVNYSSENKLIGIEELQLGFQNLTYKDIYDFQVGDEMHVKSWDMFYGIGFEYQTAIKFLERINSGDSIKYKQNIKQNLHVVDFDGKDRYDYTNTIVDDVFKSDEELDLLPGEAIKFDSVHYGLPRYGMNYDHPEEKYLSQIDLFWDYEHSNWSNYTHTDGGWYDYYYFKKGLGGPYMFYSSMFLMGSSSVQLVYYNKGDSIWGSPFLNLDVEDKSTKAEFKVVVDNFNDELQISTANTQDCTVSIYDLQGKLKYFSGLDSSPLLINLQTWSSGIYMYKICRNLKTIKYDKFLLSK